MRPSVLSRHIHEQSKKGEATEKFNAYVEANAERFIEELKAFCRQPSIAALGIGLEEMGQLVRARLEKLGAGVHLMPVDDGPPVIYAAFIPNPAWRLVWALSTLKDEEDNILVDGFLDRVAEPTAAEREILAPILFKEEKSQLWHRPVYSRPDGRESPQEAPL